MKQIIFKYLIFLVFSVLAFKTFPEYDKYIIFLFVIVTTLVFRETEILFGNSKKR